MKFKQPNPPDPITVFGLHRAGPIEVSAVDGSVHLAIGEQGIDLDRRGTDDLIHALAESLEATR
jgi:hypothetical protein